ncbi:MAG: jacalin-like lectin [Synechococcaceae cyanobacterium]
MNPPAAVLNAGTTQASIEVSPPIALFQGYNTVFGNGLSTAVAGETAREGAKSSVRCSVNLSMEELAQSLAVHQSLSVSYGPIGSADSKLDFVHTLKITTYSLTISVYARKQLYRESRTDVHFKPGISIPATDEEANRFVQYYGDSYLASTTQGGEYIGVYTFYCQTREQQTQLKADLKASGIYSGVTASADLQTSIDSFLKEVQVEYRFEQTISGLLNPKLPAPSKFIEFALSFPEQQLDCPALISFETSGYESVPGAGDGFRTVAANRTYFTGNTLSGGLTAPLISIEEAYNQMIWLANIHAFYNHFHDPKLVANMATANADIDSIRNQMSTFGTDPTASFPPLSLPALANGTPLLRFEELPTPHWGGDGGNPFNDINIHTYIQNRTRILSVGLRSGSRIDQLRTTYTSATSSEPIAMNHGSRDGGSDRGTIDLIEGMFVSSISGRAGSRVDQLQISSGGLSIAGGGSGGSPFAPWSPPDGAIVLGFRGRSGSELDQIGVVCARLLPADWTHLPPGPQM